MTSQNNGQEMPDEQIQALQALLSAQSREIEALNKELVTSYKKEIVFFGNLEQRDREFKEAERTSLKKIWWLESEWNKSKRALVRAEKELASVKAELHVARGQRDALRASLSGRVQRAYWSARKRVVRGGKA
ncbi:hypothetical protein FCK90_14025 [Kocuria coralli]|uniref:Uncharacterized protein n=1 Tax=Kocuria coralli TaxID=1461025 RepID=A0A5J5KV42_9MICC|nr:hypothetical protein [Kocuria coralli]KAA9393090.1 hypothetical protein FCK90_14025 [Kocuria coralli]